MPACAQPYPARQKGAEMIKRIFRGVAAVLICALALGALTSAMQLIGNGIKRPGGLQSSLRGEMYMSKKKKFFSLNFFAKKSFKAVNGTSEFCFWARRR